MLPLRLDGLDQEQLNASAAARLTSAQPGRNDPRIVEHQQIIGAQELRQVAHGPVLERAAVAREHHQARSVALGERLLRDERLGQLVVEVRETHRRGQRCSSLTTGSWPTRVPG